MALKIFGYNNFSTGIQANLAETDSVFVAAGIIVGSTDSIAITGTGSNHTANIQGTVIGATKAILLGDSASVDHDQHLIIGQSAYIGSYGYADNIWIRGYNSVIENAGTIWGKGFGVAVTSINAATHSTITNTGLIDVASYGIVHGTGSTETLVLQNSGTIKSATTAYYDSSSSIDQVTNTGKMIGAVILSGGNDIFDTKLGTLSGTLTAGAGTDKLYGSALADIFYGGDDADTIYGYDGNDKLFGDAGNDALVGGAGADALSGGDGIDRVYYSNATTGVTVSLLTPSLNTGEAKGDTFSSIENLTGSNYNDSLFGNAVANAISGGSGNDLIKGYAGLDSLAGGAGNDTFVFDTALNATTNIDTITDYNVAADTIQLENAIFTTLTSTGVLAATAFVKNATGLAADSSDRIIYETDTGKLFYDRDGNGASYAGVQFAKLTAGLILTNADFFII